MIIENVQYDVVTMKHRVIESGRVLVLEAAEAGEQDWTKTVTFLFTEEELQEMANQLKTPALTTKQSRIFRG